MKVLKFHLTFNDQVPRCSDEAVQTTKTRI